jgi:hypothetical protein
LLDVTVPPILILPEYEEEWRDWCAKYVKKVAKEDFWTALFFNTRARGFKQPAFVAKETRAYYLSCYDVLYHTADNPLTVKEINAQCFEVYSWGQSHAQSLNKKYEKAFESREKRYSSASGTQAARLSPEQLLLFAESFTDAHSWNI